MHCKNFAKILYILYVFSLSQVFWGAKNVANLLSIIQTFYVRESSFFLHIYLNLDLSLSCEFSQKATLMRIPKLFCEKKLHYFDLEAQFCSLSVDWIVTLTSVFKALYQIYPLPPSWSLQLLSLTKVYGIWVKKNSMKTS